jgi:microcystin-dependent protein
MDNYLGEIRLFAGAFAPRNWHFCDGTLLSITQNTALFSLLGITYGGNGTTTFALPDLRGRVPVGQGTGAGLTDRPIGQSAGTESSTLLVSQIPAHTHALFASTNAPNSANPAGAIPGQPDSGGVFYAPLLSPPVAPVALDPDVIGNSGGSQPHSNIMASQAISYIIAVQGIFPSRD